MTFFLLAWQAYQVENTRKHLFAWLLRRNRPHLLDCCSCTRAGALQRALKVECDVVLHGAERLPEALQRGSVVRAASSDAHMFLKLLLLHYSGC